MLIGYILSICFSFAMLYYIATLLQWNNYKPLRAIFNFHKKRWHYYYLIAPFLLYVISFNISIYFSAFICFTYIFALYRWAKELDKKLIFTSRIKRLFIFNLIISLFLTFTHYKNNLEPHVLDIIFFALLISYIYEYFEFRKFYKKAYSKLDNIKNCKVILITASYGKTSIKHFLADILKDNFKVHFANGSINTLQGLLKDINDNLDLNTEILIIEAGARKKGDILEIAKLVRPHYVIIGQIGTAHLEYFKNIENTKKVKLEALNSPRLIKSFTHSSVGLESSYDNDLKNVNCSLEKLEFNVGNEYFSCNLLGSFNASNIAACIKMAKELGLSYDEIANKVSNLKSPSHRLEIISKEPKFIIDDGFNGNYDGMSDSYKIIKPYTKGKKVLITPGIVEASDELNVKLASIINECFDLAIITSELNAKIFEKELTINKIILKDKKDLIDTLAKNTSANDLILFSNDAPNFI